MLKRLVPLALAGYALWQWQAKRNEKRLKHVSAKPEEVTTWEGEGGSLHRTGSHMGPEPTRAATSAAD